MQQNDSRENNPKSESRSYTHIHTTRKKGALKVQAKQYKSAWRLAECARKISAKRKQCKREQGWEGKNDVYNCKSKRTWKHDVLMGFWCSVQLWRRKIKKKRILPRWWCSNRTSKIMRKQYQQNYRTQTGFVSCRIRAIYLFLSLLQNTCISFPLSVYGWNRCHFVCNGTVFRWKESLSSPSSMLLHCWRSKTIQSTAIIIN